jgi:cytochrome c biogenesis protein CcmG, thiol:disulfide interchange protein DsbE
VKKKIVLFMAVGVFLVLVVAGLAAIVPSTDSSQPDHSGGIVESGSVSVNSPAPVFSLPDIQGTTIRLDQYLGKVVILNFWATWCVPCKEEMPILNDYGLEHPDSVAILGIAVDDSEESVRSYMDEINIGYPIVIDNTGVVGSVYHVVGYPTTYFVDAKGIIRGKYIGLMTLRILQQNLIPLGINL